MAARRRAMEYRSEQVWGTLPVVHVAVGGRQADGRYRLGRARGVIALGMLPRGWWPSAALPSGCSASVGSGSGWSRWARSRPGWLWAHGRQVGSRRRGTCGPRIGARVAGGRLAGNRLAKLAPPGR
jgi:hypothetical protein